MNESTPTQTSPGSDVFVSYASQDAAVANALVESLEKHGITCWIAPRDVTPGVFYADAIVDAINASRVLVVVLTHNAVGSTHVLREVERASAKRHPIVSLRIDAAPLPTGLEYFLSASHWLDATASGIEAVLPKLADAVRRLVATPPGDDPSQISDAAKRPAYLTPQPAAGAKVSPRINRLLVVAMVISALSATYLIVERLRLSKPAAPATVHAVAAVPEKSIAVLPFVDMSEKHDQEYFSDGLSEELIDHLAHIPDLKVIARTSSFAFKGKNEDMRSIAAKLRVANLLEGSVRKAGGELRITAQLIRASDGVHRWSESYDRKLTDIFKVQDEISTTVAKALNVALNANNAARAQSASQGTTNIDAYNLVLQGRYFARRGNSGDDAKAVERYKLALNLDPQYAFAWARLAGVYTWQGYVGELTAAEAEAHAREAVQRALAIDPNRAEAYHARGNLFRLITGDWTAARSDYERTMALDPHGLEGNSARDDIVYLRASLSGQYGDYIDVIRRNLERDPLDTGALSDLAWMQVYAGRFEDSAVTARKLLELNPAYATAQVQYGVALFFMGRHSEALAATQKESDDATRLAMLTVIHWDLERHTESNSDLGELVRRFGDRNESIIAAAYAYRGENNDAIAWLERAFQRRKGSLQDLKSDPFFRKLHGDPRFDALLRKVKLVE